MEKVIIIIPARMNSSRFFGKPLADILGKSLVQRTWQQCCKAINKNNIYVATDSKKIQKHCFVNGIQCIITGQCLTGTDRVAQAYNRLNKVYDIIINVQADEPLIEPSDILKIITSHKNNTAHVSCGMCKIKNESEFKNPNIVKVVTDENKNLLYASRAAIPTTKQLNFIKAYKQVCIYAFSYNSLFIFNNKKACLEIIEDIEILRILEKGGIVKMVEVSNSSISVDVPDDIIKVKKVLMGKVKNEKF